MTLLWILIPPIPPYVSCRHGVGVTNNLVKCFTIPRGKSGINSCANIFGASNESYTLQDNRMKNDHPNGVPFSNCKGWDVIPRHGQTVRCIIGLENIHVFITILPLTILVDSAIHVITGILVHPILVDTEERVVSGLAADLGEVVQDC